MEPERILISEARLSSAVALAALPALLILVMTCASHLGGGLEAGIYYSSFGPIVYLVFFGGLAYSFYEFMKIIMGRSRYLTCVEGYIHVLEQHSIKLDQIRFVGVERKLFWNSLLIRTDAGDSVRIRGFMLQRDLLDVKNAVEALRQSGGT